MVAAKPILAAVLAVGVGYVAYPYVTLYRLGHAIHTGDAAALQSLVDWPSVREGIKEDICDKLADDPARDGELPAFGASFVRGVAANAVDRRVTPEALVQLTRAPGKVNAGTGTPVKVEWAFFGDPTDFIVSLGASGRRDPIRLRLSLKQDATWQVTRVWLPPSLLQQANEGT